MSKGPLVYWVGLLTVIRKLCKYKRLHGANLPTDLPQSVKDILAVIETACAALEAYDKARKRGGSK